MPRLADFCAIVAVTLGLASTVHADLTPSASGRLAAVTKAGEGDMITEPFLKKGDRPGTEFAKKIAEAARAAAPSVEQSVLNAGWNDSHMGIDRPVCFDAAPKLALLLRTQGFPVSVVASSHHVFAIAESKEATLIIDPTIHQYLGQDAAPAWAPQVFVGTLSELKALFARDPGLPVMPYNEIYFNTDDPSVRRDSKMLNLRWKLKLFPNSSENAPLVRYINNH